MSAYRIAWIFVAGLVAGLNVGAEEWFAPFQRVTSQYPASGWKCVAEPAGAGLRIQISGQGTDRLLVLE